MSDSTYILHIDANNFYASVEASLDPSLRGKPIAVCGDSSKRHGIVLAKSNEAKKCGVKTAETIISAKRKCKDLIIVPPQFEHYVAYSKKLLTIYSSYTDRIESFGIDECWIDVKESIKLFKSPLEIAKKISQRVKDELNITVSIGISFCKIFAKIGSDYKKPDAITVIDKNNYKDIVWPLPVDYMLMIGKKTAKELNKFQIKTIGDLAKTDPAMLSKKFGINGQKLIRYANGIDEDSVVKLSYEQTPPSSIGHSTTLGRDINKFSEIEAVVCALSEMIRFRLKKNMLMANGVSVSLKLNNLTTLGKQQKLLSPSDTANTISKVALSLIKELYDPKVKLPIRAIGVSTYSLQNYLESFQISFDSLDNKKYSSLENSIQDIRDKYGFDSIKKANVILHENVCGDLKPSVFLPFEKLNPDDKE